MILIMRVTELKTIFERENFDYKERQLDKWRRPMHCTPLILSEILSMKTSEPANTGDAWLPAFHPNRTDTSISVTPNPSVSTLALPSSTEGPATCAWTTLI